MRSILSLRIFTSLPGSRLHFFITMRVQYSTSTPRLYAQNPVFEVVREKGVKVWWSVHSMHDLCIQCSTFDNGVYTVYNRLRLTTVTSVHSVQHSV